MIHAARCLALKRTAASSAATGGHYLLLVRWDCVAAHEEGFRKSPQYQQWKKLLHHFYDPFPAVNHYERVAGGP